MNYHNITMDDMLNGEGLRTVLWVAGCNHKCKGCQNPQTWDPNSGIVFDDSAKQELFHNLEQPYISGVTLSGGDPLFPGNIQEVSDLLREIKTKFPDKTIWLYTGYLWEAVYRLPAMECVDVLVDGEFILELRDVTMHWKGSPNQRVIDVQRSLASHDVVLYES